MKKSSLLQLPRGRTPDLEATAWLGLCASLTSAAAHAQVLGDSATCHQILAVKRDAIRRATARERQQSPIGPDLFSSIN